MKNKRLIKRPIRKVAASSPTYRAKRFRSDKNQPDPTMWPAAVVPRLPVHSQAVRKTFVRHGICPDCGSALTTRKARLRCTAGCGLSAPLGVLDRSVDAPV